MAAHRGNPAAGQLHEPTRGVFVQTASALLLPGNYGKALLQCPLADLVPVTEHRAPGTASREPDREAGGA